MDTRQRSLLERITLITSLLNGKPTIGGLRFPVSSILELLSSGMPYADILEQHPILQEEGILGSVVLYFVEMKNNVIAPA